MHKEFFLFFLFGRHEVNKNSELCWADWDGSKNVLLFDEINILRVFGMNFFRMHTDASHRSSKIKSMPNFEKLFQTL